MSFSLTALIWAISTVSLFMLRSFLLLFYGYALHD